MTFPQTAKPTAKMIRLYHFFSEQFGREPEDLWVFDPWEIQADPPAYLTLKHVMAWASDDEMEVTTFQTLGMSERLMRGASHFVELHMGIREQLSKEQRLEVARFLANVATYPFQWDLKLEWWEVLARPGKIPFFAGCPHLLLHPRLTPEGFDEVDDEEGTVKLLYLVPITPLERHLLVDHGREEFLEYLEQEEIDLLRDRFAPSEWYQQGS